MDWVGIQSASLTAVKTVLEQSDYDALWEHQYEAGYLPADSNVRLSLTQDDVIGSHIRWEVSGGVLIEKEWQDRRLVIQYNVSTRNQTLSSSAFAVASKIRGGFNLTPIQDLFTTGAGIAPSAIGSVFQNDLVSDRQRWGSQATFEVTFNAVELVRLTEHNYGWIDAVEYSGSITGSHSGEVITIADFITGAYHPSGVNPFPDLTAQMDEGLIVFNNESEKTVNFNFVFPDEPHAVIFSMWDNTNGEVYFNGDTFTSASFVIHTSAPWSGSIRYRAVYSDVIPNYPATVTSSLHASSGVLSTSVGRIHTKDFTGDPKVDWSTFYKALATTPQEFTMTHWSLGHNTGIPVNTVYDWDTDSASGSIHAPFSIPEGNSAGMFFHAAFVSGS